MTRRFLVVSHAARENSVRALFKVVRLLRIYGVQTVMLDWQAAEIGAVDPTWVPEGMSGDLADYGVSVEDPESASENLELTVVLGGDGTILRAIEQVRDLGTPVHGVNLGHVGFLAESEPENLDATVRRLIAGDYQVDERPTLEVNVFSGDQVVASNWALNEAAIEKADRQRMVNVAIEIDGRPVSSFGCDGVLLATPTGSTAYAFSAGGPVVWPEVEAFMMVPLSAHALFARPLVLGPSSTVAIELQADDQSNSVLWCDGRRGFDLVPGLRIEARLSENQVRLVRLHDVPFTNRLVSKFRLPVTGWRGPGATQPESFPDSDSKLPLREPFGPGDEELSIPEQPHTEG